jgi:hypothetical protein
MLQSAAVTAALTDTLVQARVVHANASNDDRTSLPAPWPILCGDIIPSQIQFLGPTLVPASVSFQVHWEAIGPVRSLGSGKTVPPNDPGAFLGSQFTLHGACIRTRVGSVRVRFARHTGYIVVQAAPDIVWLAGSK